MRVWLLLVAAPALWADFDAARWPYRRRLTVSGAATRVKLDAALQTAALDSLADLRVIRNAAEEVPFVLTVAQAQTATTTVAAPIVNREWRQGRLMATLEFDGQQVHNRLVIETTREEFRSKMKVEASDDGQGWATIRAAAYIFRYRGDDGRLAEHLAVHYPDSRRRRVRVTLEDWPSAAALTGVSVTRDRSSEARRSALWQQAAPPVTTEAKTACSVFATGVRAPRDRLRVEPGPAPAVFHRSVTLEESRDGQRWSWLAAGALSRTREDASLELAFPETRAPWQRLCIFQGDDEPVRLAQVWMLGVDREVTFHSGAPGTYWLYYGAAKAQAPSYDLARTAGPQWVEQAALGSMAGPETNPAYVAPGAREQPWTERHPALLYGALAAAVGGLGWMALRLLRAPPEA